MNIAFYAKSELMGILFCIGTSQRRRKILHPSSIMLNLLLHYRAPIIIIICIDLIFHVGQQLGFTFSKPKFMEYCFPICLFGID